MNIFLFMCALTFANRFGLLEVVARFQMLLCGRRQVAVVWQCEGEQGIYYANDTVYLCESTNLLNQKF